MRDVNRIDKVLDEIKAIWKANPDLRLGQLLLNVVRDPALYFIEDDELVFYLKNYYEPKAAIVYGKTTLPDGTWIENKNYISRKFGNVLKACFACTKKETCTANTLKECDFEKRDDVALFKGLE